MDHMPPTSPLPGESEWLSRTQAMKCEQCSRDLQWTRDENDPPARQAVKAQGVGVWVKNWALYGDESGYHYFCTPACGNRYRDSHK